MINRLIEWSINNRFLVFVLTFALFLFGCYSIYNIPLDALPDLSDCQVIVFTEWKGRNPATIEDQITYPIVTRLMNVPSVKVVRGYSFFGYSFIYVLFKDGTDIYWARSRVLEYLQGLSGVLPEGVSPSLGPDATGVGWGFQYALVDRAGKHNIADIRSFQDWHLKYWLQSIEGVAEVATFGGYQKRYQITFHPDKLASFGFAVDKIIGKIRASNREAGAREIEQSGIAYIARGRGYIQSLTDIENIVLDVSSNGVPILLKDVAQKIEFAPDMRRGIGDFNGEGEVVGGIVVVRYGENVLKVIERVKEKLASIRDTLPEGVEIITTYDRTDFIKEAIALLKHVLIKEAIIVSLIVIIFLLDFGGVVRAITTLPLAVAMAFIPMYYFKITANVMSLAGIAIALGAIVDEAIVMLENIHKKMEHYHGEKISSQKKKEIILEACKQLAQPMFFALLVITVSFLPVFALEEQEGRLFKPLAYTKTFTMACAAFLSLTFGPALLMTIAKTNVIPENQHPLSRLLHKIYYPWIALLMKRYWISIAIAVLITISSAPIYFKLGWEFMPTLNEGTILYMPTTLPNVSIREAKSLLQLQDKLLKEFPEVLSVHGKAGKADTATDPAPIEMFETVIQLKPQKEWRKIKIERWYSSINSEALKKLLRLFAPEERTISINELISEMDAKLKIPGVVNAWTMPIKARIDMLSTGIRTPVGIKVIGKDIYQIGKTGELIEKAVMNIAGVRSVFAERIGGAYYLDIIPDRNKLARYGLTIEEIWQALETLVGGEKIDQIIAGRERYGIALRYAQDFRDEIEKIKKLHIPIQQMQNNQAMNFSIKTIPLNMVADIVITNGPPVIKSEDASLVGWVYVDVDTENISSFVNELKKKLKEELIDKKVLPAGYHFEIAGQYEYIERVRERLLLIIPLTLFIIFILLYINFKNIAKTLMIMLTIPFAITGSIWFLWLLDYHFSIAVWIGIIALAGLAAQTGIMMIVYLDEAFNMYRKNGKMNTQYDMFEAIAYGAVQRIRPKIMTVSLVIFSLLPALFAKGAGAEALQRIAAPMIGGMITSSIMTLELIPALYVLLYKKEVRWIEQKVLKRKQQIKHNAFLI